MNADTLAGQLCRLVTDSADATPQTAKLGAWVIATALKTGGFPLEVSLRDIEFGFEVNYMDSLIQIPPAGISRASIHKSLDWLEEAGLLKIDDGRPRQSGHPARLISWNDNATD